MCRRGGGSRRRCPACVVLVDRHALALIGSDGGCGGREYVLAHPRLVTENSLADLAREYAGTTQVGGTVMGREGREGRMGAVVGPHGRA